MQIKLIQGKEVRDITDIAGSVTLENSVDSLGSSLNFSVARNYYDNDFKITETIKCGDLIEFVNTKRVFFGIIVDIETTKFTKSIKCLDFYFYLNKNKVIKQFNGLNASTAILQLLKSIGVKTGEFEKISTAITKIYKNKTVAEIIKDILKQVNDELGKKYILEVEGDTFNLSLYKKIQAKARYNNFTGGITITESIVDMKNSILVISNDQEEVSIYYNAKDEDSIKKYGKLQEIIEVDPDKDDISKVRNIANVKLKELNKVLTNATIEVIGTDELRAGRILEVINEEFGLNGSYLIKNCSHTFPKGHHIASLELEVI